MISRLGAIAFAMACAVPGAGAQQSPPLQATSPVQVVVRVAEDAVIDSHLDADERRRAIDSTCAEMREEAGDAMAQTKAAAEALARPGHGPWRVETVILEWIGPTELRGTFGLGVPGVALEARLFDVASSERIAAALAEFPAPAERLSSEKTKRVLAPPDAARRVADWAARQIEAALDPKREEGGK